MAISKLYQNELTELNRQSAGKVPDKIMEKVFEELGISKDDKDAIVAKEQILEETEGQDIARSYLKAFTNVQHTDREAYSDYKKGLDKAAMNMIHSRKWFMERAEEIHDYLKTRLLAKLDGLSDNKPGLKELILFRDKFKNRYVYDIPLSADANTKENRRKLDRVMGLEIEYGEGKELLSAAKTKIEDIVFKPGEYLDEVAYALMPLHEKMEAKAMEYASLLEKNPNALDARIDNLERDKRDKGKESRSMESQNASVKKPQNKADIEL